MNKMKKYVEIINVVLNDDYDQCDRFLDYESALETYTKFRDAMEGYEEDSYESGEKTATWDDGDVLRLEFVWKTCADDEFEMLHPASVAIIPEV